MKYLIIIMAILGFLAYCEMSSLRRRIAKLEEAQVKAKGSPAYEERIVMVELARSYIGDKVKIEQKEDYLDSDIISYGNSKHGSITILDVDNDWIKVVIKTPKGEKTKLLRLSGIERISRLKEAE